MMFTLPLAWFPIAYLVAALVLAWVGRGEFRRCPEKLARYRKLPVAYKLVCWLGVLPTCLLSLFVHPALLLVGLAGFAWLEIACVRWHRRNRLW